MSLLDDNGGKNRGEAQSSSSSAPEGSNRKTDPSLKGRKPFSVISEPPRAVSPTDVLAVPQTHPSGCLWDKGLQKARSRHASSVLTMRTSSFPAREASACSVFLGPATLGHSSFKVRPRCDSSPSFLWLEGCCFLARDDKATLHSMVNKQAREAAFTGSIPSAIWFGGARKAVVLLGLCIYVCVAVVEFVF